MLEGDTTDRFGRLFPQPLIQEIRVFDDEIQADIVLLFEIGLEDDSEEFLGTLQDFRLYSGFEFYSDDDYAINISDDGFQILDDQLYNSEGDRFLKIMLTRRFDIPDLRQLAETQVSADNTPISGLYIYCCTTMNSNESSDLSFSANFTNIDPSGRYNDIAYKSSPLSYEKIYDVDLSSRPPTMTLDVSKKIVFREADGNFLPRTPLQSLDRIYRKTDNVSHQQVIQIINPIISPFVGSIAEADRVSSTLSKFSNDASLLIELKKDINSFSNKSSATTIGQLYGDLVDAVSTIENLLQFEGIVNKRLETSNKIKDRRTEAALVSSTTNLNTRNTKHLQAQFGNLAEKSYFATPLVYRNLVTNVPPEEFDSQANAWIAGNAYFFFDFEKALNYRSFISRIFNPYNILELFGNNSLNHLYAVKRVNCLIQSDSGDKEIQFEDRSETFDEEYGNFKRVAINRSGADAPYQGTYAGLYSGTEKYTFIENFCERAFDTGASIGGYRLRAYELDYLKHYDYVNDDEDMTITVEIRDQTVLFYENQVRSPMFILSNKLQQYLTFANQFCSYNNIDGRFNDFFQEAVQAEFEQPYPWEQGPLMYYSILALYLSSWENGERRFDGAGLDLDSIKEAAQAESLRISPSNGNLDSLESFVNRFQDFYDDVIEIGGELDGNSTIYDTTTRTDDNRPLLYGENRNERIVSETYRSGGPAGVPVDVDLKVVNAPYYEIDYLMPSTFSRTADFDVVSYTDFLELFPFFHVEQLTVNVKVESVVEFTNGTVQIDQYNLEGEEGSLESVMPLIELITDIMTGDETFYYPPGNTAYEEKVESLYDNFHKTVFDNVVRELKTFDNSTSPRQAWNEKWNVMRDNANELAAVMCDERIIRRRYIGSYAGQDFGGLTVDKAYKRITFSLSRRKLEEYFGLMLINYWNYSYYYGDPDSTSEGSTTRAPVRLKAFLEIFTLGADI
jgi:hypothetical protein